MRFELFAVVKPVSYIIMIVLSNIIVNIEFAFLCYSQFRRGFIVHFDNHPAGGLILASWVAVKNGKIYELPPAESVPRSVILRFPIDKDRADAVYC
jgi:hypothetical protein